MKALWRRIQRLVCPRCLAGEPAPAKPALATLERSNQRLDALIARMADGDNPILGEKPRRPRKEST